MTAVRADAVAFGLAGVVLVVGALTGVEAAFVLSVLVAVVVVVRTVPRGGLAAALAVGLVWTNALVVVSEQVGAPQVVGLAPQLLLAVVFLSRSVGSRAEIVATPGFRWLLVYGAVVLVSGLVAEDTSPVFERFQTFAVEGVILWLLVINVVLDRRAVERVLLAMVVAAGFLGAVTVFQYVTETFEQDYSGFARLDADELDLYRSTDDYTPRLSGPTGEKNRFAQVLLVSLPLAIALAHRGSRAVRIVNLTSAVLIVGGIAVSGSRGGALGLVFVLGVLVAYRVVSLVSIAYVAAAAAAVLLVMPGYRERVVSSLEVAQAVDQPSAEVDGSILSRLNENLAAFDMFLDHPVLGVGPGGFPAQYEEYAEPIGLNVRDEAREPHNLYLGIASELGLVGLGVFLLLVTSLLRWLHRRSIEVRGRDEPLADLRAALVASITAYLVSGIFLHLSYERYLWVLLALADAAAHVPAAGSAHGDGERDRTDRVARVAAASAS